jgi:hypothetical protein
MQCTPHVNCHIDKVAEPCWTAWCEVPLLLTFVIRAFMILVVLLFCPYNAEQCLKSAILCFPSIPVNQWLFFGLTLFIKCLYREHAPGTWKVRCVTSNFRKDKRTICKNCQGRTVMDFIGCMCGRILKACKEEGTEEVYVLTVFHIKSVVQKEISSWKSHAFDIRWSMGSLRHCPLM